MLVGKWRDRDAVHAICLGCVVLFNMLVNMVLTGVCGVDVFFWLWVSMETPAKFAGVFMCVSI